MIRWSVLGTVLLGLLLSAGGARAKCTIDELAELPVTMAGLSPLVPAKINGSPVMFVADSGAFFSMISSAAAAQYHLRVSPAPPNFRLVGVGGEAQASFTTVKSFGLGKSAIPDVEFLVVGTEPGGGAVGLLGQNVLGLADVEYDFANGAIRLMRPHDCSRANLAYWAGGKPYAMMDVYQAEQRSADLYRSEGRAPQTIGTVTINGVRLHALFDTGASLTVLSLQAARRAGLSVDGPKARQAGYSHGVGRGLVRSWIVPVPSIDFGDEKMLNTEVRVGDFSMDDADMLIGADFFLSHRVFISNSQHKMFFTYNGGPVFDLKPAVEARAPGAPPVAAASASGPEPTDADRYARRGAAELSRREYAQALADLDRACELAPNQPEYVYQRALARFALGQRLLGAADLDKALELKPDFTEARIERAKLRMARHEAVDARKDLDAAAQALPPQSDQRLQLAQLYMAADQFGPAVREFDLWLRAHSDDARIGSALSGRCWTRALQGDELDKALSDCNAAVRRLPPHNPAILDSRGLVELRRGDLDRAIADYDAALAIQPKYAWALYGRGVAKLRKGLKAEGEADLAAAAKANPSVPERAAKLGIGAETVVAGSPSTAAARKAGGLR